MKRFGSKPLPITLLYSNHEQITALRVIPGFNEEEVLPELIRRFETTIPKLGFDRVEVMDADLQDPPEVLGTLLEAIEEGASRARPPAMVVRVVESGHVKEVPRVPSRIDLAISCCILKPMCAVQFAAYAIRLLLSS